MDKKPAGRLELIVGNMFSGKSTELVRRINKDISINKRILIINYSLDNRYSSDSISTHDNTSVKCLKLSKLSDISEELLDNNDSFLLTKDNFL
jgi:thymidine kinase